jgi:hypothetical protein
LHLHLSLLRLLRHKVPTLTIWLHLCVPLPLHLGLPSLLGQSLLVSILRLLLLLVG